jgi:hypothetical protein
VNIPVSADEPFDWYCTGETGVEVKVTEGKRKHAPRENRCLDIPAFGHFNQVHIPIKNIHSFLKHAVPTG